MSDTITRTMRPEHPVFDNHPGHGYPHPPDVPEPSTLIMGLIAFGIAGISMAINKLRKR